MNRLRTFIGGMAVGALAAHFLDPRLGKRRRALARNKLRRLFRQGGEEIEKSARDLVNRWHGLVARAGGFLHRLFGQEEEVSDDVLVERLRSRMGHVVSNPGSIDVKSAHGHVTLSGPVFVDELDRLLASISGVSGVEDVESHLRLEREQAPGQEKAPGQGKAPRQEKAAAKEVGVPADRPEGREAAPWPPGARLIAAAVGGTLCARGLLRAGLLRSTLGAMGLGILARAVKDTPLYWTMGLGAGSRRAGNGSRKEERAC